MEKMNKKSKEVLLSDLEKAKKEELGEYFVEIEKLSRDKEDKKGFTIKPEWDGNGVRSRNLEKVQEIEDRYEKLKYDLMNGEEIVKRIENDLSKIKRDENFIKSKALELAEGGYSEIDASKAAELEDIINNYKKRESLLTESLGFSSYKIKDAEKKLTSAKEGLLKAQVELKEIVKKYEKNSKSKNQLLRDAGEELRKISQDNIFIEKTKSELIKQGYEENIALRIAILSDEIITDEKRIKILEQNPNIQNGKKELEKITKRLEKNITERENLIKDSRTINDKFIDNSITLNEAFANKDVGTLNEKFRDEMPQNVSVDEEKIEKTRKSIFSFLSNKDKKEDSGTKGDPSKYSSKMGVYFQREKTGKINSDEENKTENPVVAPVVEKGKNRFSKLFSKIGGFFRGENKNEEEETQNNNAQSYRVSNTFPPFAYMHKNEEKQDLENENSTELTPEKIMFEEKILDDLKNKMSDRLENGKLSERIKGNVLNGLDNWENFGKGENTMKGFAKRMTKNAINLALIGLISSFAVEKLAEAGHGTAAALGGGVFTSVGRKMAIGLGMGAAFDRIGNSLSANSDKKAARIAQKLMPWVIGVGSITAASLMTGGFAGVAAGAGMITSRLIRGNFTKDKIEKRENDARKKLVEKYKDGTAEKNIAEIEKEYEKIIKKYENQRIWGRLLDGATRLTIGSVISGITMEISGLHTQHKLDEQHNAEIAHQRHLDSVRDLEKADAKHDADVKYVDEIHKRMAERDQQLAEQNTGAENHTEHAGIKEFMRTNDTKNATNLGMFNPDAKDGLESMTVQSGTITFTDASGNHVEVPYSSHGAIQTLADLKEALAKEYGSADKVPEGALSTHYVDMHGVAHDQTLVSTDAHGVTTVENYKGDMFHSGEHHDVGSDHTTHIDNNSVDQDLLNKQVNPETGQLMNHDGSGIDVHNNQVNPVTGEQMANNHGNNPEGSNTSGEHTREGETKVEGSDTIPYNDLSPEELNHVHEVLNNNMEHLRGDINTNDWNHVQKNMTVETLMKVYNKGDLSDDYKPLISHIERLEQVTDLHPYGVDLLNGHTTPETILHFTNRALEEAQRRDLIDEVTL